jgi:undecaprenyl-phosphate 4-deoxy-4-formamido-L-arabinose transferase
VRGEGEMNTNALSVSVVVPVYNEEASLNEFIRRTLKVLSTLPNVTELILVDDGSRDRSPDMISEAAGANPGKIVGVMLNRNYGKHAAVLAGLAQSRGEVVVTLDADLQNPPEEIPKLVAKAQEGYEVVGSIRVNRQDTYFRRLFSWIINQVTAKVTGIHMKDYGCMLRAYRRPVVDAMLQCTERSTFIPVLANTFAHNTTEIEVAHTERPAGESKYSPWKLVNLQFDLLTSMTTFPLRLLSVLGAIISMLGIGFGLFLLVMRFLIGPEWAAQGVFTLFAILFFFVGAQFIAMGLLGEYIGRIYTDVRSRPRYFIRATVGTSSLLDKPRVTGES